MNTVNIKWLIVDYQYYDKPSKKITEEHKQKIKQSIWYWIDKWKIRDKDWNEILCYERK